MDVDGQEDVPSNVVLRKKTTKKEGIKYDQGETPPGSH